MRSPVAPVIALLALGLLIFLAARYYPAAIQADLTSTSAAALAEAGLDAVTVSADGRDVRLTGSVPDELARARATRIVGALPGVRRIANDLTVRGPGSGVDARSATARADSSSPESAASGDSGATGHGPWRTRIRVGEGELVLEGDAPDAAFREQLAESVPERFPGVAVRDSLTVRPGEPRDTAGAALEAVLAELPTFVEGEALLRDTRLAVSGRLRAGVEPGPVEERIRRALPEGYTLDFQADPDMSAAEDSGAGSESGEAAAASDTGRPTCQANVDQVLAEGGIVFAFGSVELDPAAQALLDRVAALLLDCPGQQVEVGGHTDSAGDAEVNRRVSEARALAVTRYLARAGVPEARLTALGYGETRPVADNSTPEGRRQNRRIEFRVTD